MDFSKLNLYVMKTQTDQRWDDIIFENRNKVYGAYALRQSYSINVVRALFLCCGVAVSVFLLPHHTTLKEIGDTMVGDVFSKPTTPPVIIPEKSLPKETAPAKKTKSTLLPTRITSGNISEVEPVDIIDQSTSSSGDTEGVPVETSEGYGFTELPVESASIKAPEFVLVAEVMPSYEGGQREMIKFIQNKMSHALYVDVTGTVYVSFVVSAAGAVTNVELVKGIDKRCDQEAMRVVALMKKWKPGMQNKMPVAVRMVMPIKFVAGE